MCINLLRFMLYLLLFSNLLGCQIAQPLYGIPVPDLQQLTEAQKKALSEDYYLIPKNYRAPGYYPPGVTHDLGLYNSFWSIDRALQQRAWQQNEYDAAYWRTQHALEEQHRAWEASEAREREQRQTMPSPLPASPSPTPPSTSTQCSADTPCKQFKLR